MSILNRAHFKVSPPKCSIATQQIEFLGHVVTPFTVEPCPDKIKAILDIPSPRTLSQANRFLGKIGYYRKFIPDFARIAAPLHRVTNKTRARRHEFFWGDEQQTAFEQFKTILTTAPLFLHFPDPSVPFLLSTDASLTRIAGILKQETPTGLKICYYKSRLLSDTEQRYSATEREALAIYWCLEQLRPYIGTSSIIIETDHEPLSNMHTKATFHNKRIDNWLLKLQDILPQILFIKYRKGIDNVGPDYLTRYEPIDPPSSVSVSLPLIPLPDSQQNTSLPHICLPQRSCFTSVPSHVSDWPSGSETWSPMSLSSVTTRSKSRAQNTDTTNSLDSSTLSSSFPTQFSQAPDVHPIDFSLSRLAVEQHNDPDILSVVKNLKHDLSSRTFFLKDNVLFRRVPHSQTKSSSRGSLPS